MNALAGGLMFLAMVSYILGTYLIRRDRRREELQHPDPATISTVCMECGAHICGPHPSRAKLLSHGLCKPCAEQWKQSILLDSWPYRN